MKQFAFTLLLTLTIFIGCNKPVEKHEKFFSLCEKGYFDAPNADIFVFNNEYPIGKQGGIEIIQHGERVATCGDLRLQRKKNELLPPFPVLLSKETDSISGSITAHAAIKELELEYNVKVRTKKQSVLVTVNLKKPLPDSLQGKVFFSIKLYPPAYFGKSYRMDNKKGFLPRQASFYLKKEKDSTLNNIPYASGHSLLIAPEDPLHKLSIKSNHNKLYLIDGRNHHQDDWFFVNSIVPANKTGQAIEWKITPNIVDDWRKEPVICYSQIGYHPQQEKKAILELDKRFEKGKKMIRLEKLNPNNNEFKSIKAFMLNEFIPFYRYKYAIFDFTNIKTEGLYRLNYNGKATAAFPISKNYLKDNIWQPSILIAFPNQMAHMRVEDRYDVLHGLSHMDDGLQAPVNHDHFDGYSQGSKTLTPYKPYDRIPGMNKGGWYDAGDYDLLTKRNAWAVWLLSTIFTEFNEKIDQTLVNQDKNLTKCHHPDGKPDILQQIEHGLLYLLQQYRISGHSFEGIISQDIFTYVHQGEASTMTDNKLFDPSLAKNEIECNRSGKKDDRFVFTDKIITNEMRCAAAFASAYRSLTGYHDILANECLKQAIMIWENNLAELKKKDIEYQILAATELLLSTENIKYKNFLLQNIDTIIENESLLWMLTRVEPFFRKHEKWMNEYNKALWNYKKNYISNIKTCPFDVPFKKFQYPDEKAKTWGVSNNIMNVSWKNYFLVKARPDTFNLSFVTRGLDYIAGCHPLSNTPLVAGIGTNPLTTNFGFTRSKWSYIPGTVIFAPSLIKPDFLEFKNPFPFIWQQTEFVVSGSAEFTMLVLGTEKLLNK